MRRLVGLLGHALLVLIASSSAITVLFIFFFILKDALPFFRLYAIKDFFLTTAWYPSSSPPAFGAAAIFVGSGLVTLCAVLVAVPLGVLAAICLSDVLPFALRQWFKPIIEVLAAIPSVTFGFFALVILAPLLQEHGGGLLATGAWLIGAPLGLIGAWLLGELGAARLPERSRPAARWLLTAGLAAGAFLALRWIGSGLLALEIPSGTNTLNVSVILGIMALPTVVSVSEDALQAVGRELREGAYALGATRAEMLTLVVLPAAKSGICAAIILGVMRALGETMVVWMASGNAAQIPEPWYNILSPVRTLTATIAGDMGEADHVTGSARYHVLFAMALCLLTVSYAFNALSDRILARIARKRGR